ncbi:unannotated protein [freshwater metagenome]|uniref:Unannotated protein n=1 Tax=freshwater metagenome TaxID=449393 RepID=A0A6J6JYG4_9ZZZZ
MLSTAKVSRARRNPVGLRVNATAVASASDSRLREIAAFSSTAAIGASIAATNAAISTNGLAPPLLSLRPPPKRLIRSRKSLIRAIAPAVVAATAETKVSRLAT